MDGFIGKLGRLPRRFDARVPHLNALRAMGLAPTDTVAPPPASVDWTAALPPNLGMMGNQNLGDCTCAAIYHAIQVWTANANPPIDTEPDAQAVALYSAACGYVAGQPNTDQGGDEQSVLTYYMLNGAPLANGQRQRLTAFVELDVNNLADVKTAIADCGLVYIGFDVPDYIMGQPTSVVWDVRPSSDFKVVGGHAIILAGYDDATQRFKGVSWGSIYELTYGFFTAQTDETYALADPDWIQTTGKTPGGLLMPDLETQMAALRQANQ